MVGTLTPLLHPQTSGMVRGRVEACGEEGKDLWNGGRASGSRCVRITFLLNKEDDAEKIFQSRSF